MCASGRTPAGAAVEYRLFRPDETVHAPALIDLEVASAPGIRTPVERIQ